MMHCKMALLRVPDECHSLGNKTASTVDVHRIRERQCRANAFQIKAVTTLHLFVCNVVMPCLAVFKFNNHITDTNQTLVLLLVLHVTHIVEVLSAMAEGKRRELSVRKVQLPSSYQSHICQTHRS